MPLEIVASPLDWTSVDEEVLAKFLDTETGKRFLPKLIESVPPLLARGDTNDILIRSGEVRGFQEVARTILLLAHPAPKTSLDQTPSAYPSLTDDSAWDDGHKLEPETKPQPLPE